MDNNTYLALYSEGEYLSPYEENLLPDSGAEDTMSIEEMESAFADFDYEEEHRSAAPSYAVIPVSFDGLADWEEEEEDISANETYPDSEASGESYYDTLEEELYREEEVEVEEFEDEFYEGADQELYEEQAQYEAVAFESHADEFDDYSSATEEFEEEDYFAEESYLYYEEEQNFLDSEQVEFDREAEYLFEDFLSGLKKLWSAGAKATTAGQNNTSTNYWADFGKRAACIAEKEWEAWDKGKRHETNPDFQEKLLSYYSATQLSSRSASRAATSNLNRNSKSRSPWSAAFISYVMKKAGAGNYFYYNSSHLNYVLKAKENRLNNKQNPFQLFELKKAKPQLGDLVCNSRGCFNKTYQNVEKAKSTRCGDSKYSSTFSHCDMVVEVDEANNRVWVIGGNTGNEKSAFGGLGGSTVGKKSRRLDSNGYLMAEDKIFAILKIRTDLNIPAPQSGANYTACSPTVSNTSSPARLSQKATSSGIGIGGITTALINQLSTLLNKGAINLAVYSSIFSGNRNVDQLTDMVFYARHKELNHRKLRSSDRKLVQEWLGIKNNVIAPLIQSLNTGSAVSTPSSHASTGGSSKPNTAFLQRIQPYDHIIEAKAKKYTLNPNIIRAIIAAESDGNPQKKSVANYKGLMQSGRTDAHYDPAYSIEEGAKKFANKRNTIVRYVRKRTGIDLKQIDAKTLLRMTIAAYNAGEVTVIKAIEYAHQSGNWRNWFAAEHYQRALVFSGGYHTYEKCHKGASNQAIDHAKRAKWKFAGWRSKSTPSWHTFQDPPLFANIQMPSIMRCWVKTKHSNTIPYLKRFDQYI